MKIRKMTKQIAVNGMRIFKDEIIVFTLEQIVVISSEDLAADTIIFDDQIISDITENSEEILIT